ncbi:preprotein translocase subunit SecG [Halomonadaceae bacterium KBTZ08]
MDWVETGILLVHVAVAVALVVLVLVQQGKGADAGAAFGGGSSQTVFGSSGGVGFMVKLTAVLAALFFVTSFALAMYAKQRAEVGAAEGVPTVEESAQESGQQGEPEAGGEQAPDIGTDAGAGEADSGSGEGQDSDGKDDGVPSIE